MERIIFMAICLSYLWVEQFQVHRRLNFYLNFKPFNCGVCLSGWFTLAIWGLWGCPLVGIVLQALGYMAIAMTGFILFNELIKKI